MAEYARRFKIEAILLRDEMLLRPPPQNREKHVDLTYEHPTNPLGIEEVVDDLERLARQLPTNG